MPIDPRALAMCSALALLAGCPAELSPATGSGDDSGPASSASSASSPGGDEPPGNDDAGPELPTSSSGPGPTTGGSTDTTSGTTDEAGQTCGDGILDPGEGCDDGPGNAIYAACTDACQLNVCGDHKVHVAGRAWGRRMAE